MMKQYRVDNLSLEIPAGCVLNPEWDYRLVYIARNIAVGTDPIFIDSQGNFFGRAEVKPFGAGARFSVYDDTAVIAIGTSADGKDFFATSGITGKFTITPMKTEPAFAPREPARYSTRKSSAIPAYPINWDDVAASWRQAFTSDLRDNASLLMRAQSCHGTPGIVPACPSRSFDYTLNAFVCNACNCNSGSDVTRISARKVNRDSYAWSADSDNGALAFPKLKCPRRRQGFANEVDLRNYFDGVFVINLKRRPDRLTDFLKTVAASDWPFKYPERFEAVDGQTNKPPKEWTWGAGAWGCMHSHIGVFEMALQRGMDRVLVLEDDALFGDAFGQRVDYFLSHVPDDWGQLMIGGQLFDDSVVHAVAPGVLSVTQCERTHCYGIRKDSMQSLMAYWKKVRRGHCDWMMGDWQEKGVKAYAPDPFLAGQADTKSDINGRNNGVRFWLEAPDSFMPIIVECPTPVMLELAKSHRFHRGNSLNPKTKADAGLQALMYGAFSDEATFRRRLRTFLRYIRNEAFTDSMIPCVWLPDVTADTLVKRTGLATFIRGETVDEVLAAYKALPPELRHD